MFSPQHPGTYMNKLDGKWFLVLIHMHTSVYFHFCEDFSPATYIYPAITTQPLTLILTQHKLLLCESRCVCVCVCHVGQGLHADESGGVWGNVDPWGQRRANTVEAVLSLCACGWATACTRVWTSLFQERKAETRVTRSKKHGAAHTSEMRLTPVFSKANSDPQRSFTGQRTQNLHLKNKENYPAHGPQCSRAARYTLSPAATCPCVVQSAALWEERWGIRPPRTLSQRFYRTAAGCQVS